MTKLNLMQLAQEAGFQTRRLDQNRLVVYHTNGSWVDVTDEVVALAKLIRHEMIKAAPPYPEATFDDYPEFNSVAMGCGLEDAGHTDRYEAMRYGWYQAIEMLGGRIDNFLAAPKGEE